MPKYATINEQIQEWKEEIARLEKIKDGVLTMHIAISEMIRLLEQHDDKSHMLNMFSSRFEYYRMYRHIGLNVPRGIGKTTLIDTMIRDEDRRTIVIGANRFCFVESDNPFVDCTHAGMQSFAVKEPGTTKFVILDDVSITHQFVENVLNQINNLNLVVISLQTA